MIALFKEPLLLFKSRCFSNCCVAEDALKSQVNLPRELKPEDRIKEMLVSMNNSADNILLDIAEMKQMVNNIVQNINKQTK